MAIGPKTDKQFEAEFDFQALASAEEVKSTPSRLRAAKAAGKKIVAEEKKALAVKQRVARASPRKRR